VVEAKITISWRCSAWDDDDITILFTASGIRLKPIFSPSCVTWRQKWVKYYELVGWGGFAMAGAAVQWCFRGVEAIKCHNNNYNLFHFIYLYEFKN